MVRPSLCEAACPPPAAVCAGCQWLTIALFSRDGLSLADATIPAMVGDHTPHPRPPHPHRAAQGQLRTVAKGTKAQALASRQGPCGAIYFKDFTLGSLTVT